MPRALAVVISTKLATLHELDTVYSITDLYDLLEIASIDAHNRYLVNKPKD